MTHQLKSLAHPDWPYAGTAHEWRGFVKQAVSAKTLITTVGFNGDPTKPQTVAGVYQKQNFGPELK